MEGTRPESGIPFLRPEQRSEMEGSVKVLEAKIADPQFQERGTATAQLRRVREQLEMQSPPDLNGEDRTKYARIETDLRGRLVEGMPSQEEIRKNPPGAVDKLIGWEKSDCTGYGMTRKKALGLWKNIILSLHKGDDRPDLANFEKYRPKVSSLNMDNAQISGTSYHGPPGGIEGVNHKIRYDIIFGDADAKSFAADALVAYDFMLGGDDSVVPTQEQAESLRAYLEGREAKRPVSAGIVTESQIVEQIAEEA